MNKINLKNYLFNLKLTTQILVFFGLFSITLIIFNIYSLQKIIQKDKILNNNLSQAHIYYKKGLVRLTIFSSGDKSIRIQDIIPFFIQAEMSVNDCINGRSSIINLPGIPPDNQKILNELKVLKNELIQYKIFSENKLKENPFVLKPITTKEHQIIYKIEHLFDSITYEIQINFNHSIKRQKKNQAISIVIWLFIFAFLNVLTIFYNKERKKSEHELKKSHDLLEKRVAERTQELSITIKKLELSEDQISKSLKEKEILLQEIHHRVKNNMQVIMSILSVTIRQSKDKKVAAKLKETLNRIFSMALIHQQLYKSKDFSNIAARSLITSFIENLRFSFQEKMSIIKINLNISKIILDVKIAIPCCQIINELVTNCYKYAFPNYRKGIINVNFNKEKNNFILSISDNGIGLPKNIDIEKIKSIGLTTVYSLVDQINGKVKINRENGTEFKIIFPLKQQ